MNNQITWLVHFSALLSAIGELNVQEALKINVIGFHNIVELCRQYGLRLFCPSTIGAFGPETPKDPTPDVTLQRPTTIYGVSKVHMELLGEVVLFIISPNAENVVSVTRNSTFSVRVCPRTP